MARCGRDPRRARASRRVLEDAVAGLLGERQHLLVAVGVAEGRLEPDVGAEGVRDALHLLRAAAVLAVESAGQAVAVVVGEARADQAVRAETARERRGDLLRAGGDDDEPGALSL